MDMSSLTQKIGPLPVWAYGVIAGGGIYLWNRFHPSAATTPAPTDSNVALPGASDSSSDGSAGMPGTGAISQGDSGTPTSNVNPSAQDNQSWKGIATQQLLTLSAWSAYQIDNALSAYISGAPLDSTQQTIVSQAIRMAGSPPQAIKPPTGTGAATPPPPASTSLSLVSAGATQPVKNGGRVAAKLNLDVRWYVGSVGQTGNIEIQEVNSFTGGTWSDVAHAVVTKGTGHATVNLAKGTNRLRAITTNGKTISSTITIST